MEVIGQTYSQTKAESDLGIEACLYQREELIGL